MSRKLLHPYFTLSSSLLFSLAMSGCGAPTTGQKSEQESRLAGLPSEDIGVANFRNQFASRPTVKRSHQLKPGKQWECVMVSAVKEVSYNSIYRRKFRSIAGILTVENIFNRRSSGRLLTTGTMTSSGGRLIGSLQGETDLWVVPYDNIENSIRLTANGDLIDEWTVPADATVFSFKNGLSQSTLAARQWMAPAISNPSRVALAYSACEPVEED